jgi:hypothetical protein
MSPVRRRAWHTIAAFVAVGAVGPLASIALGRLSPYSVAYAFVDRVVWLLWPSWGLAVMEASLGTPLAATLAIGSNLILFATLGLLVVGVRKKGMPLALIWAACLGALCAWAWFGAGGALDMRWLPLLVAGIVLSVPFSITRGVEA